MDCVLAITRKENRNVMVVVANTHMLPLAVKSLDVVFWRKNLRLRAHWMEHVLDRL